MDISKFGVIMAIIYGFVETLEKFGIKKKYAHLVAIPLGVLGSFFIFKSMTIIEKIVYGLFLGISATGTCDTLCNAVDVFKGIKLKTDNECECISSVEGLEDKDKEE